MDGFQFSKGIGVRVKLTDGCNLRCKYCFQKANQYKETKLDLNILEKFCRVTFPYYDEIKIIWHGGEPTIVGQEYISKCMELVKSQAKIFDVKVKFGIQTNGTLLNSDFVKFLKRENIGVGLSFDCTSNCETRGPISTIKFNNVKKLLETNDMDINIISIVSGINYKNLLKDYEYLKQNQINARFDYYEKDIEKYIDLLDIKPEQYIHSMIELFNVWINDENCNIRLEPFGNLITACFQGYSTMCIHNSCLRRWLCIEPSGDVTPCNRIFPKEYTYGNLKDLHDIREVYTSKGFQSLLTSATKRREKCKEVCSIYNYCEGGCNYDALCENGLENNGGFSCLIYKGLFSYIKKTVADKKLFDDLSTNKIKNPMLSRLINRLKNNKTRNISGN